VKRDVVTAALLKFQVFW